MPELPEVETSRRGIEPYLVGQTIIKSVVRHSTLRWPISDQIKCLNNELVVSVQRRAKYLLIELTTGWIVIHLGMSGSLRILNNPPIAAKHDHVDLVLSNGMTLRYTDPRRFGAWLWFYDLAESTQLKHLGPEPLTDAFNTDYLYELSRNKRSLLKPWLMDNRVVVGVGNIYASESLFLAGILPHRVVNSLTKKEVETLVATIKTVLQQSIDQGGTTLKDFLQSDGKPGYFAQKLQVYDRGNQPCQVCGTLIVTEKMAQRTTYYCPYCQH